MLRKMFSLGALVVVAVTFGVANASAAPKKPGPPPATSSHGAWTDGFSDGRD
jgi:hypothetical protein